jgi:hypothetical protein
MAGHSHGYLVVTSPAAIAALVAFAESHGSGWNYPWYGPPVDRFLGDFGMGTNFLSAQGCGDFQSRRIDKSERRRLIMLIGVPDPYEGQ